MRSFIAIVAGFFVVPIVSFTCDFAFHEVYPSYGPHAILGGGIALIVLLYGTISVWIGGYVTGMISHEHFVRNGIILGVLGLLIATPINIKFWSQAPAWYHVIGLLLVVPVSAWGAHIAGKRHARRALAA